MAKTKKEKLIDQISHHDRLYYIKAEPEISDSTYDMLVREYKKLDPKFSDFQPGMIRGAQGKPLKCKRRLPPTRKKPPFPKGHYRIPGDTWREAVVYDSHDWTVFYWDVYFMEDGPRIFKRASARCGWEADLEEGRLEKFDYQPRPRPA